MANEAFMQRGNITRKHSEEKNINTDLECMELFIYMSETWTLQKRILKHRSFRHEDMLQDEKDQVYRPCNKWEGPEEEQEQEQRSLIHIIKQLQINWIGHVLRHNSLLTKDRTRRANRRETTTWKTEEEDAGHNYGASRQENHHIKSWREEQNTVKNQSSTEPALIRAQ